MKVKTPQNKKIKGATAVKIKKIWEGSQENFKFALWALKWETELIKVGYK